MPNRCYSLRSALARAMACSVVASLHYATVLAAPGADEYRLPYDNTHPVLYDSDWTNDYVDWYLMALASAGDITFLGISTSSSIPPYNRHMTKAHLEKQVKARRGIVRRGRESGFRNVPDPVAGTVGHLEKPASGKIADTNPIDSPGSRQIISQAHSKATPEKPLVICVGGPLTVVADAYLLDNSIAEKIIVAFLDNNNRGMYGFNGWSDGWAAYIVLQKLRLVQFTVQSKSAAHEEETPYQAGRGMEPISQRQLLQLPHLERGLAVAQLVRVPIKVETVEMVHVTMGQAICGITHGDMCATP